MQKSRQRNPLASCKKSATPFRSGHLKPQDSKKSMAFSRGPWYTIWPSDRRMISSKRSKVSGAGCKSDIRMVPSSTFTNCLKLLTIEKVVELSRPVDISSMNNAVVGPTIISPVVTRFLCPPEIPLRISSPINISAHTSKPRSCKKTQTLRHFNKHMCHQTADQIIMTKLKLQSFSSVSNNGAIYLCKAKFQLCFQNSQHLSLSGYGQL